MSNRWQLQNLGSLLDIQSGYAFKSKLFSNTTGMPLIRIRDLKTSCKTETFYTGEYDPQYVVAEGDLLIGMDGEFRCYEWKGGTALLNQRVCKLINFNDQLDKRFLLYGINKYLKGIEDITSFTTVKHLSANTVRSIEFPLPPLDEQKRIVSILDQAFEGLDRARANAEANLESTRELFESLSSNIFKRFGNGWYTCTIGDVLTLQRGIDITKREQRVGSIPVVSSGGVKSYHDTAYAKGPGVIVGRKGSIGSVHFIEQDYWPHDTTLWVRDFKGNEPRLVYHLLRGMKLAELDTGTANPSLNRNLVHPINISWPNRDLQDGVVDELEDCMRLTQELSAIHIRHLEGLDELRQSLLQKAFSGELT